MFQYFHGYKLEIFMRYHQIQRHIHIIHASQAGSLQMMALLGMINQTSTQMLHGPKKSQLL